MLTLLIILKKIIKNIIYIQREIGYIVFRHFLQYLCIITNGLLELVNLLLLSAR